MNTLITNVYSQLASFSYEYFSVEQDCQISL